MSVKMRCALGDRPEEKLHWDTTTSQSSRSGRSMRARDPCVKEEREMMAWPSKPFPTQNGNILDSQRELARRCGTAVQVIADIDVASNPSARVSTRTGIAERRPTIGLIQSIPEPEHAHDLHLGLKIDEVTSFVMRSTIPWKRGRAA